MMIIISSNWLEWSSVQRWVSDPNLGNAGVDKCIIVSQLDGCRWCRSSIKHQLFLPGLIRSLQKKPCDFKPPLTWHQVVSPSLHGWKSNSERKTRKHLWCHATLSICRAALTPRSPPSAPGSCVVCGYVWENLGRWRCSCPWSAAACCRWRCRFRCGPLQHWGHGDKGTKVKRGRCGKKSEGPPGSARGAAGGPSGPPSGLQACSKNRTTRPADFEIQLYVEVEVGHRLHSDRWHY